MEQNYGIFAKSVEQNCIPGDLKPVSAYHIRWATPPIMHRCEVCNSDFECKGDNPKDPRFCLCETEVGYNPMKLEDPSNRRIMYYCDVCAVSSDEE